MLSELPVPSFGQIAWRPGLLLSKTYRVLLLWAKKKARHGPATGS